MFTRHHLARLFEVDATRWCGAGCKRLPATSSSFQSSFLLACRRRSRVSNEHAIQFQVMCIHLPVLLIGSRSHLPPTRIIPLLSRFNPSAAPLLSPAVFLNCLSTPRASPQAKRPVSRRGPRITSITSITSHGRYWTMILDNDEAARSTPSNPEPAFPASFQLRSTRAPACSSLFQLVPASYDVT